MRAKNLAKKAAAVFVSAALAFTGTVPACAAYIESERKSWDEFSDFYGEEWDKAADAYLGEKAGSVNITLRLGDTVRAMASTLTGTGLDFSWLESIGLEIAGSAAEDSVFDVAIGLLLNDTVLASAELPINFENNSIAFRVPQISADYLGVPFEFENDESLRQWEHLKDVMSPEFLEKHMPDGEVVASLLKRYGDILFDGMTEEEAGEETVNVCGVEQNFTVYEGRLSEEGLYQVTETMLQTAKSDPQFKEIVENLGEVSSQPTLYEEYQKNVDKQLQDLQNSHAREETDESNYISSRIWVNADGENAGREIIVYSEGEKTAQLDWLSTEKDGKAGFRLFYDDGGRTPFLLSGSGEITDGMLSGDYTLSVDGEDVLAIAVTDYDVDLKDGDVDGTYELTYIGDTEDAMLSSFSLLADVEEKAAEEKSRLELSLMMEDEMFASLRLETGMETELLDGKVKEGTLYRADNQEEVQAYVSGLDVTSIMENCKKAGVPDDFLEQVTSLVMQIMMSSAMDEGQEEQTPYMEESEAQAPAV